LNRLIRVDINGSMFTEYSYDAVGNRLEKKIQQRHARDKDKFGAEDPACSGWCRDGHPRYPSPSYTAGLSCGLWKSLRSQA